MLLTFHCSLVLGDNIHIREGWIEKYIGHFIFVCLEDMSSNAYKGQASNTSEVGGRSGDCDLLNSHTLSKAFLKCVYILSSLVETLGGCYTNELQQFHL